MSKEINRGYQQELLEHLLSSFNVESPLNNKHIIESSKLIKSGYFPILISNHQSHADGIPHALIAQKLIQQSDGILNGFYLPIAASIETGHQGHDLQKLITEQKPFLSKLGLNLISVTREKDKTEFGIPYNNENIKKLIKSPEENYGFVLFPEGTVKGGRINLETNLINGMIRPDSLGVLDPVIRCCQKNNKPFFFLPVGIDGSYKIVSPDHGKNGNQINEFKTEEIMNFINVQNKVNINIGNPISDLNYENFENKLNYLMFSIAKLLPIEAQGIYSQSNRTSLNSL